MADCIFCKIVNKEIPSEFIYEDERVIVIKDIRPKAPVHLLIITKEHIPSVKEIKPETNPIVSHMIFNAKELSEKNNLQDYKLVFNVGKQSEINHLHLHLLAWKDEKMHVAEV